MLNARLYRTCWLIAGVALVVALLTLEAPAQGPEPALPSTIDGQSTLDLSSQLAAVAPERPAGSGADLAAAQWVQGQLSQVPGAAGRVQVQRLKARMGRERVDLRNVYLAVPGSTGGAPRPGILVVAPRDTPVGVSGGASATAVLLQLARASATARNVRPHLFVSTDGSTAGNAGIRWFLSRFSEFRLAAAVVLDAPGEVAGDRVEVWAGGRIDRQALALAGMARRSVQRAGGRADGPPSMGEQLLRLAVPQTFGDQGAAIANGLPAVTLSGRRESPLRPGAEPTAARMGIVANAANDLIGAIDAWDQVPAADGGLAFAGKVLRPTVARLVLLLFALPVMVMAVDAVARSRRARVPLGGGLRAVALRAVPLLTGLAAAHLLSLAGLLPGAAAGAPQLPAATSFGAAAGLGLALSVGAGVVAWRWARRRPGRAVAPPAAEGTAALAALAALLLVLWLVAPYSLVLAIPAANAALVATAARRVWQVAVLAGVALIPILFLAASTAARLDSNPVFAIWYLIETAANGSRGAPGVILAALVGACLWSLGSLVAHRIRKGGLSPAADGTGYRRARRPRPRTRIRLRIDREPRAPGGAGNRW